MHGFISPVVGANDTNEDSSEDGGGDNKLGRSKRRRKGGVVDKGAMSLLRSLFSLDISIQNAGYIWKTVADEEQEAAGVRGADKVVGVNDVVIAFGVEDVAAVVNVISVHATSSDMLLLICWCCSSF